MRILIIDDEPAIRKFLRVAFETERFSVVETETGKEGLAAAASQKPDLIVLDLGLPDMNGIDVLKKLREWSKVPVIVLTVDDLEISKVALLDAGADDFMTKPFGLKELLARIRASLRHVAQTESAPMFESGDLQIDFTNHQVKLAGREVKFTVTEYNLLKLLAQHAGKVVTQRQLLKEIWGPNSVEHSHYLRVYVAQLRKKLEHDPHNPELIVTEPGVGYRLLVGE